MVLDARPLPSAGRYEIGPIIGQGGMGRVYRARDTRLSRDVAIKVLRPGVEAATQGRQRFEREARAAARISHPNVVAVYDVAEVGDERYIVMECLPGRTLADELAEGPVSAARARSIAHGLLGGLAAAHAQGVLHRDIKPGNVLLSATGAAKLGDFGIASLAEGSDLTATGLLIGTAPYLAPERLRGESATASGDQYALGVVLYEVLAGRLPYGGQSPVAIAHAMITSEPVPIGRVRPDVEPALTAAIDRSMDKDPTRRFPSVAAMTAAVAGTRRFPTLAPEPATTALLSPVPARATGLTQPVTAELQPVPATAVGSVPRAPSTARPRRRRRRAGVLLGVAVMAVLVIGAGLALGAASRPDPALTTTTTTPPATTTVPPTTATTVRTAPAAVPTTPPTTAPRAGRGRDKGGKPKG